MRLTVVREARIHFITPELPGLAWPEPRAHLSACTVSPVHW